MEECTLQTLLESCLLVSFCAFIVFSAHCARFISGCWKCCMRKLWFQCVTVSTQWGGLVDPIIWFMYIFSPFWWKTAGFRVRKAKYYRNLKSCTLFTRGWPSSKFKKARFINFHTLYCISSTCTSRNRFLCFTSSVFCTRMSRSKLQLEFTQWNTWTLYFLLLLGFSGIG